MTHPPNLRASEEALKPCPCCGDDVCIVELDTRYSCYAIAHEDEESECPITAEATDKKALATAWNRRARTKQRRVGGGA